jgi:integrase
MRNDQKTPSLVALTLGDVHDIVARSNDLSPVRIRDLISAIACFCDLIGVEPKSIPLDLTEIRDKLNAINPVANGIGPKRLANIRSDLFAAIAASRLKLIKPAPQGLTGPWQVLIAKLKTKRHRIGLSRLAHYASAAGLKPVDVDDGVIKVFMTSIREGSLHRKPNDLHRTTTVIWNEVARAFPELGLRPVSIPSFRPAPKRIDLSLLPDSFHQDLENCLAWSSNTDPFAPDARSRPLAPASIRLRRDQIHAAVSALVEGGVDPASVTALADLVTVPNFKKIAQQRLSMANGSENSFNRGLATTLIQIAKEWVKTDDATLLELKRLASKVPGPRGDLTAKNKRFLRQFDDPQVLQRLRALPTKLWLQARRDGKANFRTLAKAQAALAVEMLIYLPIRLQNLVSLTFERHLFLNEGPGAVSTLEIPATEVKNKRPIEFDIPPHITRMLIEYRDHIALRVLGRKPDRLFINPDGTPKVSQTLAWLIRRMCRKYAGIEVSPHKFRHLAAKVVLDDSPGAFELVKQLLGHENLKTTANCYAGIDTRRAARHHHRLLEQVPADRSVTSRRRGRKRQEIVSEPKKTGRKS